MTDGYIKLWRKSLESRVFQNKNLWHLWTYCLLKAAHKSVWLELAVGRGTTEVFLKAGQLIFGSKKAARDLHENWSTIYYRLKKLEAMGNLQIEKKAQFSIVTISNWDSYQTFEKHENVKTSNSFQTQPKYKSNTNQTYKNNKNEKKEKKIYAPDSDEYRLASLLLSLIGERKPDFRKPDLQAWADHFHCMITRDERRPGRIEDMLRWCQRDGFWQNNILSPQKLRQHFDRLEMEEMKHGEIHRRDYEDIHGAGKYSRIGITLSQQG